MLAITDFVWTLLVVISLWFTRIHADQYSCDDIFAGKVLSEPACDHNPDDPEINSRCRIDLGVPSVSSNALHILEEGLKNNVKLCFGCAEDNFYGQCNTVIACHPRTVCYNETHTNKDSNIRHMYGCLWESDNVFTADGHHCSQPSHGSPSGTKTCGQPKLCNGGQNQQDHIANLLNSLHTTTSTSTKPTTTTVPTTTTSKPTTTTVPTTTTSKPTTTTFPATTITQKPVSTGPTPCKLGNGLLKCADFNNSPFFTCETYDRAHNNTLCSLSSNHDRAVQECPQYCGYCDEYCQLLYNAQGITQSQTVPPATSTQKPITTTVTTTTTTTTTLKPSTALPTTTSTIATMALSKQCKQGNGTLMCKDHDNPPYFVCKTFDHDSGLCGWIGSGHDRAVDQCPLYCGLCDEYCQKLYNALVTTTLPTTTSTTITTTTAPTTTTTQPTTASTETSTTTTTQPTTASTKTSTTTTTAAPTTTETTTTPIPTTTFTTEPSTTTASTTSTATTSTAPPCVDLDATCPSLSSFLCTSTDAVSLAYAKLNCAKTCKFCGQSTTTTSATIQCVDHDLNNNCANIANVLCNSQDDHTKNYAIANCAKTCNLCSEYLQLVGGVNIPLLG